MEYRNLQFTKFPGALATLSVEGTMTNGAREQISKQGLDVETCSISEKDSVYTIP